MEEVGVVAAEGIEEATHSETGWLVGAEETGWMRMLSMAETDAWTDAG